MTLWDFRNFAALGIGAVVGLFSQFATDLVSNVISYNIDFSSWQSYVGSVSGAISGGVGSSLGVFGLSAESYLTRGIMAGTDAILGLGGYIAQNAINMTMNSVSFGGCLISFAGGLFDLCTPVNKYFDAFWAAGMAGELGLLYDVHRLVKRDRKNE